jgi:hypothetical protein
VTIIVLLICITGNGRPACMTHEFTSFERCEAAATEFVKKWGNRPYYVCVPK